MEGPSVTPEAAAATAPQSASDKLAAFEQFLEPEEGEEEDDVDTGTEEGDDLDIDEEEGEAEDEPETPAIDPPASLNAEEKATFSQLPVEAQQVWAASETRRNTQVQEATTKAANAQRDADHRAASADAEARAINAQRFDQFISAFEPQMPDPQLAQIDPARYIAEEAQYRATKAQHDALVQQVRGMHNEATTEAQQGYIAQRNRELMAIPEIANPETRETYLDQAMAVASDLGYTQEEVADASAGDIKALAKVAAWKADSEKYRQALSKQMQKVRASKGKSLRPNAAPHADARTAKDWTRVTSAKTKEAKESAFADYMGL